MHQRLSCLLVLILALSVHTQPPKPVVPALLTKLPEARDYQKKLRAYLGTLTEKDFTHGVNAPLTVVEAKMDAEFLYRNHLLTLMSQPLVGTKRGVPAINAPASLFLLSSIESAKGVLLPPVWPETLMTFVQWDYPGNPYYNNRALKFRAFVTATVMMVMLDDHFDAVPAIGRSDWFAYQLVYFGLPYPGFKDVLPPEVRKAYETGLKRMGQRVLDWGIKGEDPHADLIGPLGLHCVARAIDDAEFTKATEAFARKLYTEPRYFNPVGYWTFRGGLDLPFNGNANFFAASTGLATGWPFVKEALERTYRLRAHMILPEPDGKLAGPSHFNSRVSGPVSIDQWAWNGARDSAAAMLTDEAAHLLPAVNDEELRMAPGKRAQQFASNIRENPVDGKGGFITNDQIVAHPWQRRVWMTYNFPASINPGYEFYRAGALAHRRELEKAKSPMLKSPFERGESFFRAFGNEFVVVRQPTFAAILHTGPVGTQDPSEKMHQFKGPMGLGGGQLSAFWTPAAGSVLLGQRGGMTYDKSFEVVEAWRTWPIHAVSGSTTDGVFFTSARIQKPDVVLDVKKDRANVKVSGVIPASVVGQDKKIVGKYEYARTFQIDDKSVTCETTIRSDGKEPIAELYETLPVYLRDAREQPKATPTIIEFQIAGKWTPATERFAENIHAIRMTRFTGTVVVTLDRPRRVKLSPSMWEDTFLSRGTARNVLIDLLENKDQPTLVEKARNVRYTIVATPAK